MTPQLSIVKTRFAKASLRPRCARHRSWRATCRLPNGCVGHSATQWLLWTLSYPMVALDTQLPNRSIEASSSNTCRADHPSTEGYDHMVAGSGRLPTPHTLLVDFQHRGNLHGADPAIE